MKRTHYFFVLFNFLVTGVFGGEHMTAVFLHQLSVNGTVRNNQGTPPDGVTLNIKDANTGTATDAQGRFVLENVSADAILLFSSVGYKDLEMGIAGRSAGDVVMEEDMA